MVQKRLFSAFVIALCVATAAAASDAIDAKYKEIGAATLGNPIGAEKKGAGGGRVRLYANGGIYWSNATGTHAVSGPPFEKYKALGAEGGKLGYPVTDVVAIAGGGTQTLFRHGYIAVGKSGEIRSEAMSKATFSPDRVDFSGGAMPKMSAGNEAFVQPQPQSPPTGSTITCSCYDGQRLAFGMCDITIIRRTTLQCKQGSCASSCRITVVKDVQ